MASLVNEDGVPLNVSGAVRDDTDARNLASHLRGELTPAQKRDREYYTPAESLSTINEEVHKLYDTLLAITKNPEDYTEKQINKTLYNKDQLLDRLHENYFSGNYQANLGNREEGAYKYWRMYRSNKKNWDKRRDAMVEKERKKLNEKGMKITDEMTPKEKREMQDKRREALRKVRNKYNRGDLGQQINYLIEKVNDILLEERYKEDEEEERFSAAAYVPRQKTARQAKAAAAIRGLPNLRELKERRARRKQERQERMSRFAEGYTKSSPAKASSKPKAESAAAVAKPTAKQNWKSEEWRGPYKSRRNPEKRYLVREEDELGVFLDDEGKLTERNIRKAEEHKAKKEAAKKAAKKGGMRKTRKKKGGINPAEFNHLRSNYIHQLRQRERLERELQECRQDLHNATTMDSAGVRESKSNLEGGRRKTRKMKGGHHLYKRLGVSKYASQKQIKKAYNKLKKKKKLTQKVKYAYKILSKKKSRKKYNAKYKKHKKHKNTKKRKKKKRRIT